VRYSRFLTRKPPLLTEPQPTLVDTRNALDMSAVLPRTNFPKWEVLVVVGCFVAYLIILEVANRVLNASCP
jgi:hypothetical protein